MERSLVWQIALALTAQLPVDSHCLEIPNSVPKLSPPEVLILSKMIRPSFVDALYEVVVWLTPVGHMKWYTGMYAPLVNIGTLATYKKEKSRQKWLFEIEQSASWNLYACQSISDAVEMSKLQINHRNVRVC